jgi:ankyrin repeat protein
MKYIKLYETFEEDFAKEIKYISLTSKSFDELQEMFNSKVNTEWPNYDEIQDLIDLRLVQLDGRDKHGLAPLHYIARLNDGKLARMLLKEDANIDVKSGETDRYRIKKGMTPLHVAVKEDNSIASLFIKMGADINATDDLGNTVLFYTNNDKMLNFLLKNGADKNIKNKYNKTAWDELSDWRKEKNQILKPDIEE